MKLIALGGLVAFAAATTLNAAGPAGATQTQTGCHPAYVQCLPLTDVDCAADKLPPIQLRQVGVDPYRLDDDNDGIGCENGQNTPGPTQPTTPPTTKGTSTPTTKAPTTTVKKPGAVKAAPRFTG